MKKLDVITVEVIKNGVNAAAREMATTLVRTAYNPLLYEVQDFGLAILSPQAKTWAEAPGMTVFVGALPQTVETGIGIYGLDGFEEGDVLIANDPYTTGNHISDVSIYMPIFFEGQLLAFAASTAHWADIAGKTPGGWCSDSVDVYQEGICYTHEKLVSAGKKNDALWSIIRNNTRYPAVVLGDMQAQIAACRQGAGRIQTYCRKYGVEAVTAAMNMAIDNADRYMRQQIAAIPDGTYGAELTMDHDGVAVNERFTVALQLTVAGDTIKVSFDGASPVRSGPVNCPEYAVRSVVRAAIKGALCPQSASNEGDFIAIEFDLPKGLVVSPERPAPVDSYGYVANAAYELTMKSLAQAIPDKCVAGCATLTMPTIARVNPRDGTPFILADPIDVGNGARPYCDGPTMAINVMGDVPNSPVEVVEMRYPLRVEQFALKTDSSGHGRYRGGAGVYRDYRILEEGISLHTAFENTFDSIAKGTDGGYEGMPAQVVANPDTLDEYVIKDRGNLPFRLKAGDVISMRSGGGGGWGVPATRDPNQVVADVRDDRVSVDLARDIYRVAIDVSAGEPVLMVEETGKLRA